MQRQTSFAVYHTSIWGERELYDVFPTMLDARIAAVSLVEYNGGYSRPEENEEGYIPTVHVDIEVWDVTD